MQRSISIVGRRWFDSYYGNTYNTVTISVQFTGEGERFRNGIGGFYRELPMEYGYGDSYEARALGWLRDNLPAWRNNHNRSYGSEFARNNDWHYHCYAQDVDRKRDL